MLFQLYRELSERERPVHLDPSYSYQWKRTDLLYELWGYLKIIRCLSGPSVGFVPVAGWLFDRHAEAREVLVPFLQPGTTVIFRRGDLRIHWVYDAVIPEREAETNPSSVPLYTASKHNRPDGRIDLFKGDVYIGSLIVDFKYRRSRRIFDSDSKAREQLSSYRFQCNSSYLYGQTLTPQQRAQMRPVGETWAIYPGDGDANLVEELKDYRIKLIQMRPGQSLDHMEEQLAKSIREMVDVAESWGV